MRKSPCFKILRFAGRSWEAFLSCFSRRVCACVCGRKPASSVLLGAWMSHYHHLAVVLLIDGRVGSAQMTQFVVSTFPLVPFTWETRSEEMLPANMTTTCCTRGFACACVVLCLCARGSQRLCLQDEWGSLTCWDTLFMGVFGFECRVFKWAERGRDPGKGGEAWRVGESARCIW